MLIALLFSCSQYPPPDPLDPELTACDTSPECVVVELGCCDSCNGGTAVAVNEASVEEVVERYSESCGRSYACTLMDCGTLEATCDAGTCTLQGYSM